MNSSAHNENVIATVESPCAAAKSPIAASWRRSILAHGLSPEHSKKPKIHSQAFLTQRRRALEQLLIIAGPRLDRFFQLVGSSGCGIALTDRDGVIINHRFSDADVPVFEEWGLRSGADWSEAAEGTNGIGTCLAEQRAVTIHRDEHFFTRNIGMSCIDAPIYGDEGQIIAALDVSSARADQTKAINGIITAMVAQTALKIEADYFRANFIGATRGARKAYGFVLEGSLPPMPAADLFGRDDGATGFEKAERAAVVRALLRANNNVSVAARGLGVSRTTLYRRMKRLGLT